MAHIHEKIDYVVGVYIIYQNKVLIRKHEKYGMWTHVGGHIELDEDPITAGIRECKEEVGLDIKMYVPDDFKQYNDGHVDNRELLIPAHMNIHRINDIHQHIDLIYYATSNSDVVAPENADDQWLWLTKEEVENHPEISEKIKHYALSALNTVYGKNT